MRSLSAIVLCLICIFISFGAIAAGGYAIPERASPKSQWASIFIGQAYLTGTYKVLKRSKNGVLLSPIEPLVGKKTYFGIDLASKGTGVQFGITVGTAKGRGSLDGAEYPINYQTGGMFLSLRKEFGPFGLEFGFESESGDQVYIENNDNYFYPKAFWFAGTYFRPIQIIDLFCRMNFDPSNYRGEDFRMLACGANLSVVTF